MNQNLNYLILLATCLLFLFVHEIQTGKHHSNTHTYFTKVDQRLEKSVDLFLSQQAEMRREFYDERSAANEKFLMQQVELRREFYEAHAGTDKQVLQMQHDMMDLREDMLLSIQQNSKRIDDNTGALLTINNTVKDLVHAVDLVVEKLETRENETHVLLKGFYRFGKAVGELWLQP